MGSRTDLIRRIYGFNWAAIRSRREGFAELSGLVTPEFESQLSPELGERVLPGVRGLEMFVEAVEQDFSEFHYQADEIEEIGEDQILVLGRIFARARATGMPLSGDFGHIWTVRDGLAARVEAHRDHHEARRAAGLVWPAAQAPSRPSTAAPTPGTAAAPKVADTERPLSSVSAE